MKRDQMLVEGFLSAYNRYHGTSYKVIRRPEVSNRRTQGVEAVAADEYGRTVALEHTLVEPFKGERSVNSRGEQRSKCPIWCRLYQSRSHSCLSNCTQSCTHFVPKNEPDFGAHSGDHLLCKLAR